MASGIGATIVQLQEDLSRKYRRHGEAIDLAWRSFTPAQRTKCLKAGAADGVVLQHPDDTSLGSVCKFIPEWNVRDISNDPEHFLDLLYYRACCSPRDQYHAGLEDAPGDFDVIHTMMQTKGLRHRNDYKDCFTFFSEDEKYGQSFKIPPNAAAASIFKMAQQSGVCIPQAVGELILQRQVTLMQSLTIMMDDVLEEAGVKTRVKTQKKSKSNTLAEAVGDKTGAKKSKSKKSDKEVAGALSKLSIQSQEKPTLATMLAAAQEQKVSFEEYQDLLTTEPIVLAHAVNITFFTRPELISDEKGRKLPTAHTDRHISSAFFEAIHDTVKNAAIWSYLVRLLELYETSKAEKSHSALILQELSNVCYLEYGRTQSFFKRNVQSGTGSKWFKRVSNVYDKAGNARVTIKGNPEELTRSDPQLHYVLRLCQPEITAPKAVDWVAKLGQLYTSHPLEQEKLDEREAESLANFATTTGFINDLSSAISVPSFSRKKGQLFTSKFEELDIELSQFKKDIDLYDFVVPIDNLLEPGMAEAALKALDQFIIDKAGTKLGFLYQDLVEESLSSLKTQCEQAKAKLEQKSNAEVVLPVSTPEKPEQRIEQRKQKEKTRPSHSSVYEITPRSEKPAPEEGAPPSQMLKVNKSTAEVFSAIFAKSESRGSVNWSSFESAMASLGFSVQPRFGSVYTFSPPESIEVKTSFTVHRPHQSRIEGWLIPIFARRLKRVYGWSEKTFEV